MCYENCTLTNCRRISKMHASILSMRFPNSFALWTPYFIVCECVHHLKLKIEILQKKIATIRVFHSQHPSLLSNRGTHLCVERE